jgi:transcriptional regulator with XRE-family HTH domain
MRFDSDALKASRDQGGLTQEQLAVKAGVVTSTISRLERGEVADPGIATIVKLAIALDLDPADLLILEASA